MTSPAEVFAEFEISHKHVNRFFWSTDASYHLAFGRIDSASDEDVVGALLPATAERRYTFRRYRSKGRDAEPTRATVSDLRDDLKMNTVHLVAAAIIAEVGNLELFLRRWSMVAAKLELAAGKRLPAARRSELEALIAELETKHRLAMTLAKLGQHFPAALKALGSTTYRRTLTPFLSAPTPGCTCLDAAQMWREIRNLLLHHAGRCHQPFVEHWQVVWDAIDQDIAKRGLRAASRGLEAGKRIPLNKRHAPYCFSSCYQTAYVFFLAAGGSPTGAMT